MGKVVFMEERSGAKREKDIADVSKLIEKLNKKNANWQLSVFFDSIGNIIYGDLHNKKERLWDYEADFELLIEPGQIQINDSHNYAEAIIALYHSENNYT
jgi:hypothetical protein